MHALDRRDFLKLTAAGTAGLALSGCGGLQARRQPNVLLVFPDQLRADMCSAYGGRNLATPNIDRLASEGVVFTNAVSTCPLCTPYRGMLQTGRYPTHSGIIINFVEASPAQNPHCMADAFAAAGYATGYVGKWHLGAGADQDVPLVRSIDRMCSKPSNPDHDFVPPGPRRLGYRHWQANVFHYDYQNYWWYEDEPIVRYSGRYETDTQTDQAISFMEKCRQKRQPFFLTVASHPPHPPFTPEYTPAGYLDRAPQDLWWSPNVPADRRDDDGLRCYLAMINNVDDNFGRLLDYLDRTGLGGDTIVVFTSDHGEMLGSHSRIQKMVPYAEAINVPCLMRWPGHIPPGTHVDSLQTPMDHFPTLCGLVGLPRPSEVDGADLSGAVTGRRGGDGREGVLIGHYSSGELTFETGTSWPEWRGVRTKQYTYARWLKGSEELYDNVADPYQMTNLVDAAPAALGDLRARLADLLAAAHDDFRPGTDYLDWYDDCRNLVKTALGPVPG